MKWFLNRCRRRRQNLCLLASGVLSEQEAAKTQFHLSACADCRKYYAEIKMTALTFATWEKHFGRIEPRPSVQARWAKAIESAGRCKSFARFSPRMVLVECWRQLIWPSRRIWAGIAAAWVVIVVVNLHDASNAEVASRTFTPPSPAMLMALREPELWFNELAEPREPRDSDRQKKAVTTPRSEWDNEIFQA